jgi:large subunit ribosomal protein L17
MYERIITTEAKAKAVRPYVEKLVTKARKGPQAARLIAPYLAKNAVEKMINDIAPRFVNRPGGYTRILHADNRLSDNAPMAMMEWVEKGQKVETKVKKQTELKQGSASAEQEKKATTKKSSTSQRSRKSRSVQKEKSA